MRVLLAIDGSVSGDAARQAVAALAWPTGSIVNVLGVIDWAHDPKSVPGVDGMHPSTPRQEIQRAVEAAVAALQRPGLAADGMILTGRAATEIVEVARKLRSELIVVGSRGRGPIASLLLGSVSAEVVDHAGCPVLVVRGALTGSVLVAVDGSPTADAAVAFLTTHRFDDHRPLEVLSVLDTARVAAMGLSPRSIDAVADHLHAAHQDLEIVAAQAAMRLRAVGYRARWSVEEGHPAQVIMTTAADRDCGLIVLGSRGMTGLERLLVGSVARTVLLHAGSSVLIVHEPLRAMARERTDEQRARSPLLAGAT